MHKTPRAKSAQLSKYMPRLYQTQKQLREGHNEITEQARCITSFGRAPEQTNANFPCGNRFL
jgi:hypothetical protein